MKNKQVVNDPERGRHSSEGSIAKCFSTIPRWDVGVEMVKQVLKCLF